jgi:hypothetical protein
VEHLLHTERVDILPRTAREPGHQLWCPPVSMLRNPVDRFILIARSVIGLGLVEHNQTDVTQQQGSHLKITHAAQSPVPLLSVHPRQQVG